MAFSRTLGELLLLFVLSVESPCSCCCDSPCQATYDLSGAVCFSLFVRFLSRSSDVSVSDATTSINSKSPSQTRIEGVIRSGRGDGVKLLFVWALVGGASCCCCCCCWLLLSAAFKASWLTIIRSVGVSLAGTGPTVEPR